MRIDYKLIELKKEKNIQPIESFIELSDNILYWKARYYCDIPKDAQDLSLGWENKMKSGETWVKKSSVIGIGKAYMFRDNIWQIFLDANGLAGTIEMFFKRESDAIEFAEKIVSWMIEKY